MLELYGERFTSRLLLGTAQYPSPAILRQAVEASGAEIVTVSVRRESARVRAGQGFWELIEELGVRVLPNTAGCRTVKEAVATAQMARELFSTSWIKLEVIANDDTLQPELIGLVEAANMLVADGFQVLPYTTEDLSVAERLVGAGCTVLMPWASPIGSARGLTNRDGLKALRAYFPDVALVVDAGIGAPSDAAEAMELGYDAVLLNTAIAKAGDPVTMASAFAGAIEAGRLAFNAGLINCGQRGMAQIRRRSRAHDVGDGASDLLVSFLPFEEVLCLLNRVAVPFDDAPAVAFGGRRDDVSHGIRSRNPGRSSWRS
jgi:thiazole synthase